MLARRYRSRRRGAASAALICWLLLPSFARAGEARPLLRFEYSQVAMGVRARIVLYAASEAVAERAAAAAFRRIARLEHVMSDYRSSSELMRLCARAGGPPVRVSRDLLLVLHKAQEMAQLSDGAFDVTVGPLVRLWREARSTGALPPQDELERARRLVGWRKVALDANAATVRLETAGMLLDLGGIAKGYACDEALRVLACQGVGSALVQMGGDIAVSDAPPGKTGWHIEIASPGNAAPRRLTLCRAAVSSSGDIEQYVEIGGRRYSHIVDPRTGLGLTSRIAVTVIAPDGITADALATAISVLGPRKGQALARRLHGVRAYIRTASD